MHIEMSLFGDAAPRKSLVSLFRITRLRDLCLKPVCSKPDGSKPHKKRQYQWNKESERPDNKMA